MMLLKTIVAVVTAFAMIAPAVAQDATLNISPNLNAGYDALDAATSVRIVRFSTLANADVNTEDTIFGASLDEDLTTLRSRIAANAAAMLALAGAGLRVDRVVALGAARDGEVAIYVNDL